MDFHEANCGLWAIEPRFVPTLASRMKAVATGLGPGEKMAAASSVTRTVAKAIAVIPIIGVVEKRRSMMMDYFGGASTDEVGYMLEAAVNDDRVKAVILDMDTPGGMVYGTPELANKIYAMRGRKPIVAISNPMACSAGHYIGSAADRFYVCPSGDVGSVGVYVLHVDMSKAYEDAGVKVSVIRAGEHKIEANPWEPMTEDVRKSIQDDVDDIYQSFVGDVAKFRGKTRAEVLENFGKGRAVSAKAALAAGMVDGIATFDQVVARLQAGKIRVDGPAAMDDWASEITCEPEPAGDGEDLAKRRRVLGMKAKVRGRRA